MDLLGCSALRQSISPYSTSVRHRANVGNGARVHEQGQVPSSSQYSAIGHHSGQTRCFLPLKHRLYAAVYISLFQGHKVEHDSNRKGLAVPPRVLSAPAGAWPPRQGNLGLRRRRFRKRCTVSVGFSFNLLECTVWTDCDFLLSPIY